MTSITKEREQEIREGIHSDRFQCAFWGRDAIIDLLELIDALRANQKECSNPPEDEL